MIDALYNYRQGEIHSAEFSDEFNALCMVLTFFKKLAGRGQSPRRSPQRAKHS